MPFPRRVLLVGMPSAGKTALGIIIGHGLLSHGVCVGVLAVDEDPEDVTVRLAQLAGYHLADLEDRDPAVMASVARDLAALRVRLYGTSHTIESAGRDLAAWAEEEGCRAALVVDSIQTVTSEAAAGADNIRAHVEGNVAALRSVSTEHGMLVVATSEANRASYRTDDAAELTSDMASGAESRSIEFGAQTMLMVRTPKGHPDVIHVRVPKNRRLDRGEFWLRLDRVRHIVEEVDNPADDPDAQAQQEAAAADARMARRVRDAQALAAELRGRAGLGSRDLRKLARDALGWGVTRTEDARDDLAKGLVTGCRLVNRGTDSRPAWTLEAEGADR